MNRPILCIHIHTLYTHILTHKQKHTETHRNTFIMIIVTCLISGMLRTPWTSWRWRRWTEGIGKKPKTFFRFSLISNIINAIKIESPRDCNHWWRNDKKQFQSSDMYTWLVLVMGVFYAIPSLQVLINAI